MTTAQLSINTHSKQPGLKFDPLYDPTARIKHQHACDFVEAVKATEQIIWPTSRSKTRRRLCEEWPVPNSGGIVLKRTGTNHYIPPELTSDEVLKALDAVAQTYNLGEWNSIKPVI